MEEGYLRAFFLANAYIHSQLSIHFSFLFFSLLSFPFLFILLSYTTSKTQQFLLPLLLLSLPLTFSLSQNHSLYVSFQKRIGLLWISNKHDIASYSKTRKNPHCKAGQVKPGGEKGLRHFRSTWLGNGAVHGDTVLSCPEYQLILKIIPLTRPKVNLFQ